MLEEIYKAGEVDPRKLPRNFDSLSAQKQVKDIQLYTITLNVISTNIGNFLLQDLW